MSDKKEFWIIPRAEFTKINGETYWQALSKEPEKDHGQIHVIEHAAYEAEKERADEQHEEIKALALECATLREKAERADRLEIALKHVSKAYDELYEQSAHVENENQKLSSALRAIASGAPDYYKDNKLEHAYLMDLARKALNEQN